MNVSHFMRLNQSLLTPQLHGYNNLFGSQFDYQLVPGAVDIPYGLSAPHVTHIEQTIDTNININSNVGFKVSIVICGIERSSPDGTVSRGQTVTRR